LIANEHGGPVYQSVGYPGAWDGNSNGKQLPTGVYYYL